MATTKLFEQIPNTLNNYKDTQLNQPSLAKTVFNSQLPSPEGPGLQEPN